jgi:hypothetical protein
MTDTPKHIEVMASAIRECRHYGRSSEDCATAAHAALTAAGYVVVPREPTEDMVGEGAGELDEYCITTDVREIYRAMIEAAQKP